MDYNQLNIIRDGNGNFIPFEEISQEQYLIFLHNLECYSLNYSWTHNNVEGVAYITYGHKEDNYILRKQNTTDLKEFIHIRQNLYGMCEVRV